MTPPETPPAGQARKLGLASGRRLWLDGPPAGWGLADVPDGVVVVAADEPADIIIAFFTSADRLAGRLEHLAACIYPAGMLWVAWPRRAAGHASDITDTAVRDLALPLGLVDTKVAALDHDWSALRVVWRRERRPAAS
jgi:hypothetical protein